MTLEASGTASLGACVPGMVMPLHLAAQGSHQPHACLVAAASSTYWKLREQQASLWPFEPCYRRLFLFSNHCAPPRVCYTLSCAPQTLNKQ